MMKMAVRWGYIKYNVAANVEKKKLVSTCGFFLINLKLNFFLDYAFFTLEGKAVCSRAFDFT